ncbi:MAG TPA: hypothetical protein VKA70_06130 [Blastocatellia bacterium]|nr:hypothetical protein [Blastocatellia bacterium]
MPFATTDVTQMMGIGNYVGEMRPGPDGNLYEWVQGVDGLGNPIGFWKVLKKATGFVRSAAQQVAKRALPMLSMLIPPPLKSIAKRTCTFLPKVGPVVQTIPEARVPFQMANKFCGVLRKAGIAGVDDGFMEVAPLPNLSRTVPAPVRGAAKTVCNVVDKLSPIVKFIPPVRPYATGATALCRVLRGTGIAGVDDGIMAAPDGQLYEVVEGIGEFGERRRFLRRVRVNITFPAVITRRRTRRRVGPRPVRRLPQAAARVPIATRPIVAAPVATAARPPVVIRPAAPAAPAVRRYR